MNPLLNPHTGQPVGFQGVGYGRGADVSQLQPLLERAGLWDQFTGGRAAPAQRFSGENELVNHGELTQWMDGLNWGMLDGYGVGESRDGYNITEHLRTPDGRTISGDPQLRKEGFKSDDYAGFAAAAAAMLAGGYGIGALGGAGAAAGATGGATGGATAGGIGTLGGAGSLAVPMTSAALPTLGTMAVPTAGSLGLGSAAAVGGIGAGLGAAGGGAGLSAAGAGLSSGGIGSVGGGLVSGASGMVPSIGSMGSGATGGSFLGNLGNMLTSPSTVGNLLQSGIGMYANNKALGAQADANNQSNALLRDMFNANRADNAPGLAARNWAMTQGQQLLQDPSGITKDPGYQFGLRQGQNALDNKAAATGNYYSGQQMKAASQYNQDYAGTKLDSSLNRLLGLAGQGSVNAANNQSNNNAFGQASSNNALGMGNVRGSSYMNGANQIGNAVGNIANQWQWQNLLGGP